MLDNLKLVLVQNKKFLVIFFVVVFLPSVILAFFGIRAIRNERYKVLQQNLEQQKQYVNGVKAGISSIVDRDSLGLKELSSSKAIVDQDHRAIRDLTAQLHQEGSLLGQIVIWNDEDSPWLLGWQPHPPAANPLVIPDEWKKWRSDLVEAEKAEFRRKNFSEAVSAYNRILEKAENKQIKAWILSRIARCEIKQKNLEGALEIYRSIVSDFADLLTESGRPLELVSRLEMLEAFCLDKNYANFYGESLDTYYRLERNVWSLDGGQIRKIQHLRTI